MGDGRESVANIGPRGRRSRLLGGIVWLLVAVAGGVVLALRRADPFAYASLIVPLVLASLGAFQARDKT